LANHVSTPADVGVGDAQDHWPFLITTVSPSLQPEPALVKSGSR
jgi:hypothetical protein